MRRSPRMSNATIATTMPIFHTEAANIMNYLATKSDGEIQSCMHISTSQMVKVREMITLWNTDSHEASAAIDTFIGDIYSGLQPASLTDKERHFANRHLIILSGLYGGLRPLDAIQPYRLEMGYRLPDEPYRNLYTFWKSKIATLIPSDNIVINVSSAEYTKAVLPYIANRVITPKFLTVSPKTSQLTFVAVHAKIARGAFARWCIVNQAVDSVHFREFDDLGYVYQPDMSTPNEPVYVCKEFKGLGLSIRLR